MLKDDLAKNPELPPMGTGYFLFKYLCLGLFVSACSLPFLVMGGAIVAFLMTYDWRSIAARLDDIILAGWGVLTVSSLVCLKIYCRWPCPRCRMPVHQSLQFEMFMTKPFDTTCRHCGLPIVRQVRLKKMN